MFIICITRDTQQEAKATCYTINSLICFNLVIGKADLTRHPICQYLEHLLSFSFHNVYVFKIKINSPLLTLNCTRKDNSRQRRDLLIINKIVSFVFSYIDTARVRLCSSTSIKRLQPFITRKAMYLPHLDLPSYRLLSMLAVIVRKYAATRMI